MIEKQRQDTLMLWKLIADLLEESSYEDMKLVYIFVAGYLRKRKQ